MDYESLSRWAKPLDAPMRPLIGREKELVWLLSAFERPELCNVMLLGEAGSGKTALMQGASKIDKGRLYLAVDIPAMIAGLTDVRQMSSRFQRLFAEAEILSKTGRETVLFIDEFHQIIEFCPPAAEAVKPLLAESGRRGVRIAAATTYEEFREWIAPNQALAERFERISLTGTDEKTTAAILASQAEAAGISRPEINSSRFKSLCSEIYTLSNRYIPANAQPRKSIIVLDAMIGRMRYEEKYGRRRLKLDRSLLAELLRHTEGIDIDMKHDADGFYRALSGRVYNQPFACRAVTSRLRVSAAGLNDPERPMGSFLFTGSTGVGKTEMAKQMASLLFSDRRALIRFDMTEFVTEGAPERFRAELTAKIWEKPASIVLFDEIEKADPEVIRMLMAVLDDGRMADRNGRESSFLNAYIILTTNAASEVYREMANYASDVSSSDTAKADAAVRKFNRVIRRSILSSAGGEGFPPELLGRIDAVVPFAPLSEATYRKILKRRLDELGERMRRRFGTILYADDRLYTYFVDDKRRGDTDGGGARSLASDFSAEAVSAVSEKLLASKEPPEKLYLYVEGVMASDDKYRLDTDARAAASLVPPAERSMRAYPAWTDEDE